jgi:hypothetical protein
MSQKKIDSLRPGDIVKCIDTLDSRGYGTYLNHYQNYKVKKVDSTTCMVEGVDIGIPSQWYRQSRFERIRSSISDSQEAIEQDGRA